MVCGVFSSAVQTVLLCAVLLALSASPELSILWLPLLARNSWLRIAELMTESGLAHAPLQKNPPINLGMQFKGSPYWRIWGFSALLESFRTKLI